MPPRRPCRYRHSSVTPPSEVGIRRTSTGRPQRSKMSPAVIPTWTGCGPMGAFPGRGVGAPESEAYEDYGQGEAPWLCYRGLGSRGSHRYSHTSSGGPGHLAGKASARPGSPQLPGGRRSMRGYWHVPVRRLALRAKRGARRCPGWLGSLLLQPGNRPRGLHETRPAHSLRHPQPGVSGRGRSPGSAGRAPPDRFVVLRRSRRKCSRASREPSAPSVSGRKGPSRTGLALPRERLPRGRAAAASRDRSGPRNRGARRVQPGSYA
jgi:hypothetical protein